MQVGDRIRVVSYTDLEGDHAGELGTVTGVVLAGAGIYVVLDDSPDPVGVGAPAMLASVGQPANARAMFRGEVEVLELSSQAAQSAAEAA